MNLRKKVNLFIIVFVTLLLLPTVIILIISFREYSIKSSVDKANAIAKIVRDGLTSHMENGTMDKRNRFLSKIRRINGVENLKILRSSLVDRQFGKAKESFQKIDNLEKEVLKTGKEKSLLQENADFVKLKVVIPYIASQYETPNCLKCHNAKEGEVLGAISMDFDITDIRDSSFFTIGKILLIIFFISIVTLFVVNVFIKKYIDFFENVKYVAKSAYRGDYSNRIKKFKDQELDEVSEWLNSLFDKIENSLKIIIKNVAYFVNIKKQSKDPLLYVEDLVSYMASIYKFKNIVEKDKDITQIYNRIIELLKEKYKINNFIIYEIDKKSKKREVIYKGIKQEVCSIANENIELCRAYRTHSEVISDKYLQICPAVKQKAFYICLPLEIDESHFVIVSFVSSSKEEYKRVKEIKDSFMNYLYTIKDSLKTKILLRELEDMSLKDRLTGAYNRRFLDAFVKENIPKALRANTPYSILMLDIDFFKEVNDNYGHDVGDRVIQELVKSIFENIRESDNVIRFGGEEFLVLLYNCKKEDALEVAKKIKDSFQAKKIDANTGSIQKTVSIGISEFPRDSKKFWQAIKFADMALYRAKESGRNKIVIYDKEKFKDEESY